VAVLSEIAGPDKRKKTYLPHRRAPSHIFVFSLPTDRKNQPLKVRENSGRDIAAGTGAEGGGKINQK